MDWNQGYVIDTPYTYGYYPEMAPARVEYAMVHAGFEPPPPGPCCELGFGHGVTLNLSAAADPARRWWGNDFNPSQARFARSLSESSGAQAVLDDSSFAEFCARDDLPVFSMIALHGVWSWTSTENQRLIVDFVRRRLALGGVLYVSYNTRPGWAAMAPVRPLFFEYARAMSAPTDDSARRMQRAIDFVDKVLETNPLYHRVNPSTKPKIEAMRKQSASYLPHEYLNEHWSPTTFGEMVRALDAAKLTHAGNASLLDRIDVLHLDGEQRKLLGELPDPALRETVREFMTDTTFRRDYWVRGGQRLTPRRQRAAVLSQKFVLAAPPDKAPVDVKCGRGRWDLKPEIYRPLLAMMDGLDAPISRAELGERVTRELSIPAGQFNQALAVLIAIGVVQPAQTDERRRAAADACARVNARILGDSADDFRVTHLISPVTGMGVPVDFVTQLLLGARSRGLSSPELVARAAQEALVAQNQKLRTNGQPIEDPQASLEHMTRLARDFEGTFGRILGRLGLP